MWLNFLSKHPIGMAAAEVRQDAFKRLKHGACADAYHDFKHYKFNRSRVPDAQRPGLGDVLAGLDEATGTPANSIPTAAGPDKLRIENDMLKDLTGLDVDNVVRAFLQDLISKPGFESFYRFEGLHGVTPYRARLIGKEGEPNLQGLWRSGRLTVGDWIDRFSTTAGTTSLDLNFVVDAAVISMLECLKALRPTSGKQLRVNFLMNRELINDPAPKVFKNDTSAPAAGDGVRIQFLYDASPEAITYAPNSRNLAKTDIERDKFFSKFEFQLSPLAIVPKKLPLIHVDIKLGTQKLYHNPDPHENNAILQCWKRILNAFRKRASKHQDAAVHFQCKRSGDWFQALSCLDMGRPYLNPETKAIVSLPGARIVLVTHDVVLLWYALFIGVDVLFTTKTDPRGAGGEETAPVDEAAEATTDGSPKYGILFQNWTNVETPVERAQRLVRQVQEVVGADGVIRALEGVSQYITAINIAIQRIQETTRQAIEVATAAPAEGIAAVSRQLHSILKAYYKLQAIQLKQVSLALPTDYIGKFREVESLFNAPDRLNRAPGDQLVMFSQLLESLLSFILEFQGRRRRLPETDLANLEFTETAYEKDDLYSNMPTFVAVRVSRRGAAAEAARATELKRCLELVSIFKTRLSVQDFWRLYEILTALRASASLARDEIYLLDTFLGYLGVDIPENYQDLLRQQAAPIQQAVQQTIAASHVGARGDDMNIGFAEAIEEEQGELAQTRQRNARLPEASGAADRDEEPIPAEPRRIKAALSIGGFSSVFRDYANWAFNAVRAVQEAARSAMDMEGGASRRSVRSHRRATHLESVLVLAYLRQLQQVLMTIDYNDPDAIFYDCAGRLALAGVRPDTSSYAHYLYGTLLTTDFKAAGLVNSEPMANNIIIAARQIALQALGLTEWKEATLLNPESFRPNEKSTYERQRETLSKDPVERRNELFQLTHLAILHATRVLKGQKPSKTRKVRSKRTSKAFAITALGRRQSKSPSKVGRAAPTRRSRTPSAKTMRLRSTRVGLKETRRLERTAAAAAPAAG